MLTFRELQKFCKNIDYKNATKVAILGDSATQFLTQSIKGYACFNGINLDIFDADYNQIDFQILDKNSELYKANPQFTIIYMSAEKLYDKFKDSKLENRKEFAENILEYIKNVHNTIKQNINTTIIQFNFIEIQDGVFGNYANSVAESFLYQIRKLNYYLSEYSFSSKNFFIHDIQSIASKYGYDAIFNTQLYYSSKMCISTNMLPYVGKNVVDIIKVCIGKVKKCVILDLDNTLWGGIIGDDGLNGIQIGYDSRGKIFTEIQEYFLELKKRGILLAICSKNNEEIAKEPFLKHPDMVLKLDDISIFVANWNDKASNIKYIQETLNIGMDSIVFVDDNKFERELVKSIHKDLFVIDLPDDEAEYLAYIKSLNLFETISYSKADLERTQQYQVEFKRKNLQAQCVDINEYLQKLHMKAYVSEFDEFNYERIAQLTQRSNQFNLRTKRYTEDDIRYIAENKEKFVTLYFMLEDEYGKHGLISVVILEKLSNETLFIDTWIMSCRVLKRGMEDFIVNKIIDTAKKLYYKYVKAEYIPTQKNAMVKDIYLDYGFVKHDNDFIIEVKDYKYRKNYIEEKS